MTDKKVQRKSASSGTPKGHRNYSIEKLIKTGWFITALYVLFIFAFCRNDDPRMNDISPVIVMGIITYLYYTELKHPGRLFEDETETSETSYTEDE